MTGLGVSRVAPPQSDVCLGPTFWHPVRLIIVKSRNRAASRYSQRVALLRERLALAYISVMGELLSRVTERGERHEHLPRLLTATAYAPAPGGTRRRRALEVEHPFCITSLVRSKVRRISPVAASSSSNSAHAHQSIPIRVPLDAHHERPGGQVAGRSRSCNTSPPNC